MVMIGGEVFSGVPHQYGDKYAGDKHHVPEHVARRRQRAEHANDERHS